MVMDEKDTKSAESGTIAAARPKRPISTLAEILTLVVLALTLAAVICYTRINQQILNANIRPYVAALSQRDLPGMTQFNLWYKEGMPLKMNVTLVNFGRLPADAIVWSILTYSEMPRDNTGPFVRSPEHVTVWPQPMLGKAFAYSQPLSAADVDSIRHGSGFVYFVVKVEYGGYETRVCEEFSLSEARDITLDEIPLPMQRLCSDRNSNKAT